MEHIQLARQWVDSGETESKKTGNEKETSGVKKRLCFGTYHKNLVVCMVGLYFRQDKARQNALPQLDSLGWRKVKPAPDSSVTRHSLL